MSSMGIIILKGLVLSYSQNQKFGHLFYYVCRLKNIKDYSFKRQLRDIQINLLCHNADIMKMFASITAYIYSIFIFRID